MHREVNRRVTDTDEVDEINLKNYCRREDALERGPWPVTNM